jgi:hypothetical protein
MTQFRYILLIALVLVLAQSGHSVTPFTNTKVLDTATLSFIFGSHEYDE